MAFENFTGNTNKNSNNSSNGPSSNQPFGQNPYQGGGQSTQDVVKQKLINYNAKFKNTNPILYRDEVIQQAITAANRIKKPNLVFIGGTGVGKTQIVEELARLIANDSHIIPDKLKGKTIYELPLVNITAGTQYRGQMEENIKEVIEFFENPNNKAILFIDELHSLLKYDEISQALKPALARGKIRFISATTITEYQKIQKDPAFSRRVTPIIVDELTVSQTTEILKHIYPTYEKDHDYKITIPDTIFEQIVHIADRNPSQDSHRPDNAITLMDHAMSALKIDRLKREDTAIQQNDQLVLQALQAVPVETVNISFLSKVAEQLRTGNAKVDMAPDKFEDELSHIKGQDHIINDVISQTKRARLNLNIFSDKKPLSFLFVGPSGVGKTEITKIMSRYLTGNAPIIINMPEYNSAASVNRLIGSPIGYVGSDSKQELPFDTLRSNPQRVILIDEFEKGDIAVQRLFMAAIDEGQIRDNRGNIIDFSKSIIIATTNAGQTNDKKAQIGFTNNATQPSDINIDIDNLQQYFDRELINRFQHCLQFKELTKSDYIDILLDQYELAYQTVTAKYPQYTLNPLTDQEIDQMVKDTYVPANGARPIKNWIQTHIENQILPQI